MNGDDGRRRRCRSATALLFLSGCGVLPAAIAAGDAASHATQCRFDAVADGELTLARAMDLALCNNAELQSAAASVRVRAAELGETRSEYWPSLDATVSEVRDRTRYPDPQLTTADTATTVYGTLTWRLFDFGGRRGDALRATKLLEAAIGTRDATIQRVLGSVVEMYYDAVMARALLNNKAEDERLARETLGSAERRMGHGDGAQSDMLQARTALAGVTLEGNRARSAYEKSLVLFAYSVGLTPAIHFTVAEEVDVPTAADARSLSAWLEDAERTHPTIMAARAEVAAAQAQVVSTRSSDKPTVNLQTNYFANGFPQQGLAPSRQRSATVGIAVSVPLFDGFLHRYKVQAAEATVQVKEAALVDAERLTLTDIMKAYFDATAAIANLRGSQDLLDAAQLSQASSKRRYEAGATDILELLNTQVALADARQERARSLAEWRSARLRLLATSGVLSNSDAPLPP